MEEIKPLPRNLDNFSTTKLLNLCSIYSFPRFLIPDPSNHSSVKKFLINSHAKKVLQKTKEYELRLREEIPQKMKKNYAKKRLMKDMKEMNSCYLETICASPLENDIFEWHVNLLAPVESLYYGCCFHLKFLFDDDYPIKPPKVMIMTEINHSHVFGGYYDNSGSSICLDMLGTHDAEAVYYGWSSCYSVLSLCLQLQSFLFEEEKMQKRHIPKNILKSLFYKCIKCQHSVMDNRIKPRFSYWNKFPDVYEIMYHIEKRSPKVGLPSFIFNKPQVSRSEYKKRKKEYEQMEKKKRIEKEKKNFWNNKKKKKGKTIQRIKKKEIKEVYFTDDVLMEIFQFFERKELFVFSKVCQKWKQIAFHPYLVKNEIMCFHSKSSFKEDVLGYGFSLEYSKSTGKLMQVSTPLDLISMGAFFNEKVRKSVWNVPFSNFLPLYISDSHFRRGEKYLIDMVKSVYRKREFEPHLAIDILCKFTNSMIVKIMNGSVHASFKALQGYCYFHRLLIHYVQVYPEYLRQINNVVWNFKKNDKSRHKTVVSSLGEFLPLVSLSKFKWDDIKVSFIMEVFDRNALWIKLNLRDLFSRYKNYSRQNPDSFKKRCFENAKISLRLIMFHVTFLNRIICERNGKVPIGQIAESYDRRFGCSDSNMKDVLQKSIFEIQKVNTFKQFFDFVGMKDIDSLDFILYSIESARKRGYFGRIETNKSILKWVPKLKPKKKKVAKAKKNPWVKTKKEVTKTKKELVPKGEKVKKEESNTETPTIKSPTVQVDIIDTSKEIILPKKEEEEVKKEFEFNIHAEPFIPRNQNPFYIPINPNPNFYGRFYNNNNNYMSSNSFYQHFQYQ